MSLNLSLGVAGAVMCIGLVVACASEPVSLPNLAGRGSGGRGGIGTKGGTPSTLGGQGAGVQSTSPAPGATSSGGQNMAGGQPASGAQSPIGGQTVTGGQASGGTSANQGGGSSTGGQASGGSSASGGQTSGGSSATAGSSVGGATPITCPTEAETKFSFFLISREAVQRESGSTDGYGGDLGGLAGADAICQKVAEYVSKCQSSKVWRAFLSTSTVDAIDRIGTGPWYDRNMRLLANGLTDLLGDRPTNADPVIKEDFPNEYGIPNHAPDGTQVDNHEILTGSGTNGRKYTQSATPGMQGSSTSCQDATGWTLEAATCWGWTTKEGKGCPRVGHSWPRAGSGTNWISCWNEGGCAPGGNLTDTVAGGGLDGTRRVGSAGGYGGWYCFAVIPTPA